MPTKNILKPAYKPTPLPTPTLCTNALQTAGGGRMGSDKPTPLPTPTFNFMGEPDLKNAGGSSGKLGEAPPAPPKRKAIFCAGGNVAVLAKPLPKKALALPIMDFSTPDTTQPAKSERAALRRAAARQTQNNKPTPLPMPKMTF